MRDNQSCVNWGVLILEQEEIQKYFLFYNNLI